MSSWKTALPASASASAGCRPGHTSGQVVAKGAASASRVPGTEHRGVGVVVEQRPLRACGDVHRQLRAQQQPDGRAQRGGPAVRRPQGRCRPTRPRACAAPSRCPRRTATPRLTSRVRAGARMSGAPWPVQPGSADAHAPPFSGRLRAWTSPAGPRTCRRSPTRRRCPAGSICTVLGGTLADGRAVVVKRCPYPAEVEADGLAALAAAGAPVPAVLAATGDLLVLERVDGPPDWAGLGRAVARLHRTTGPRFGWHRDNSGRPHRPAQRLARRLADVLRREPGAGAPGRPRSARRAAPSPGARLRRAAAGVAAERPPASLTHGDLWTGNVVGGRWLVDPAVAYVDRELELAFLDMADLPAEFHAAYRAGLAAGRGLPAAPSGAAAAQAAGEPAALRRAVRPAHRGRARRLRLVVLGSRCARARTRRRPPRSAGRRRRR